MNVVRRIWDSQWPARAVRVALGALFALAGALKLADPQVFAVTVKALGLVPGDLALPLAVLAPAVEVLAGLGLLLNLRGTLSAITALLLLFMGILAYALWLGLDIDCGCYGPADPAARAFSGLWTALWRDAGMLAGAAYVHAWRAAHGVRGAGLASVLARVHIQPGEKEECAR